MKAATCTQRKPSASNLSQLQSLCCCQAIQTFPKHPRKRIWCFQCQLNVRPEWKQHEQKVFFKFSNTKIDLTAQVFRVQYWVVNSHGFQLENLMTSGTEMFQPPSKHLVHTHSGATDGERQEKVLLLLPHWAAIHNTKRMEGGDSLFFCQPIANFLEKHENFY